MKIYVSFNKIKRPLRINLKLKKVSHDLLAFKGRARQYIKHIFLYRKLIENYNYEGGSYRSAKSINVQKADFFLCIEQKTSIKQLNLSKECLSNLSLKTKCESFSYGERIKLLD